MVRNSLVSIERRLSELLTISYKDLRLNTEAKPPVKISAVEKRKVSKRKNKKKIGKL